MSTKIKWGVLGSGGIARRRTIPEGIIASENASLSIVFDVNKAANAEVAKQFNAVAAKSVEEVLASDIDAVYIATPAYLHYEQVMAAAKAGKHILCEKPLGMSVKEAEEMVEACKSAGVKFGAAFMMRFLAQHQEAARMVKEGMIGKPVFGRAQLSCWYPPIEGSWRQDPALGGGGSLIDMGGHCIDLLEMFFGPVTKVSCFMNNSVQDYESEDSAVAMLFFKNGAIGTVDTFFCIPDSSSKNVLELYGSKGSILAKGTIGQGEAGDMMACLEDSTAYDAQQTRSAGEGLNISPTAVNAYRGEIEEFSQAIIENREPQVGAEAGLQSQKVIAACYESAKTGKVVKIG